MDIQAPEKPLHNLKDFALHIATVTLGILIALGLEGVRESVHDRHLLRETRENIQDDMKVNQEHSVDELERVTATRNHLQQMIAALPAASQQPDGLIPQLDGIDNPFYFFSANSWQAALSTGALARMSPAEVNAYSDAAEVIHRYTALQNDALLQETRTVAYLHVHTHPTPAQMEDVMEMLLIFERDEQGMVWVCPQMQQSIATALRASARY